MLDIVTVAFWILLLIAIVNPLYMVYKCRMECDNWRSNFYFKNHTRPSAYSGIHVQTTKGVRQMEEQMLLVEVSVFTIGAFFFYWQITFENILDAK